eukprot:scaffold126101_cov53-Prasinocladus_malaysianus.AAC.2
MDATNDRQQADTDDLEGPNAKQISVYACSMNAVEKLKTAWLQVAMTSQQPSEHSTVASKS